MARVFGSTSAKTSTSTVITPVAAAGLPTTLAEVAGHPFDAERLVRHMAQDKKAEGGRLTFILAHGLGQAFVAKDADPATVRHFLQQEGAA